MSEIHRKLITSNCIDCGCEIHFRPSKASLRCKSCSYKYRNSKVEVMCSCCGNSFKKKKSSLNNSIHKLYFCNRGCKEKAQSLSGNCPSIRPNHYGNSNGKHLWDIIIDNAKKCTSCEETKKYLFLIHHIDGNRENNKKENLEVICGNCHMKRHLRLDENNNWIYDTKFLTPRDMIDKL